MILALVFTFLAYIATIPFLGDYFDRGYFLAISFYWKCLVVMSASLAPVAIGKWINKKVNPQSYDKLQSS